MSERSLDSRIDFAANHLREAANQIRANNMNQKVNEYSSAMMQQLTEIQVDRLDRIAAWLREDAEDLRSDYIKIPKFIQKYRKKK